MAVTCRRGSQVHEVPDAAFPSPIWSFTCDFRYALFDPIRNDLRPCRSNAAACRAIGLAGTVKGFAQGNVPIVRDAEIKALVRDYARPIFTAAGCRNRASTSFSSTIQASTPSSPAAACSSTPARCCRPIPPTRSSGSSPMRPATSPVATRTVCAINSRAPRPWRSSRRSRRRRSRSGSCHRCGRPGPGRCRHRRRRRRIRPPRPAWLSALRGNDRRPIGDHLSRSDRAVGQGHADYVPAVPERAVALGAVWTPIRSAIRHRATASRTSSSWRKPAPITIASIPRPCSCAMT